MTLDQKVRLKQLRKQLKKAQSLPTFVRNYCDGTNYNPRQIETDKINKQIAELKRKTIFN